MESVKINKVSGSIENIPYITTLKTASHTFISDEPESLGGKNKGPLAHDYLLGALVACTCITIQMYAGRKQWKIDQVSIDAVLKRSIESGTQNTSVLLEVSFNSDLNEEQINRIIFIAGKCPVHKTLAPAMEIEIKLKK